jgi:exodeoxyribonuclease VII large subunit
VLEARLRQGVQNALSRQRRHLEACSKLLGSLSYQGVLKRGFALVRDADGRSVRSVRQVARGERLDIELADGHVAALATETEAPEDGGRPRARPARGKEGGKPPGSQSGGQGGNQGSLF